jgi:hypothetical protein
MSKVVTVRETNQSFARCILELEADEEFVIAVMERPSRGSCR